MHAKPTFDDAVVHRRIDASEWRDIYVIGDVHGCRATLDRLLERLDPAETDLLVFVGDLVRKGPDSQGVVERVRQMDNAVSVLGNNEAKLLRGDKTLPELTDADHDYIESMPVVLSWEDSMAVHGGIDHRKSLTNHSREDLLNMRSLTDSGGYTRPYWFEQRRERPRVFFGHTVLAHPFETDCAVGLDTGCVYGGQLTAYDCTRAEFIAVDPVETHVSRSEDSIVEPTPGFECLAD